MKQTNHRLYQKVKMNLIEKNLLKYYKRIDLYII